MQVETTTYIDREKIQRRTFRVSHIKFFLLPPFFFMMKITSASVAPQNFETCGRSIGFTTSSPRWGCGRKTRRSCFWCVVLVVVVVVVRERVLFSPASTILLRSFKCSTTFEISLFGTNARGTITAREKLRGTFFLRVAKRSVSPFSRSRSRRRARRRCGCGEARAESRERERLRRDLEENRDRFV